MIRKILMVGVLAVFGCVFLTNNYSMAIDCPSGSVRGSANSLAECNVPTSESPELWSTIKNIINVIIGVTGLIAVVMIIIGGINYTTSQGDPTKTKKATQTLLFSVIGLVVAVMAFAIVNFVLDQIFGVQLSQ